MVIPTKSNVFKHIKKTLYIIYIICGVVIFFSTPTPETEFGSRTQLTLISDSASWASPTQSRTPKLEKYDSDSRLKIQFLNNFESDFDSESEREKSHHPFRLWPLNLSDSTPTQTPTFKPFRLRLYPWLQIWKKYDSDLPKLSTPTPTPKVEKIPYLPTPTPTFWPIRLRL